MNVLFLRPQPAIRSLKYAIALKHVDADLRLYHGYTGSTLSEFYGHGDEYFEEFIKIDATQADAEVRRIAKRYDIDVIHSQNAPDELTVAAIRGARTLPIIHENQDAISLRTTPYHPGANVAQQLDDERIANERCDARIHVTKELCTYIQQTYGAGRDVVFYNYVSASMLPTNTEPKRSSEDGETHIVYEGTLASLEGDHYDLRAIFRALGDHGFHVHIYDSHANDDYRRLAAEHHYLHYHGHVEPRRLLRELTQYDYGWSGFNVRKNKPHIDVALPNKLFEYLSCGLPVLSFPHRAQTRFIETHDVGIIVNDIDGLPEALSDQRRLTEIRRNVMTQRTTFTVERHIQTLHDLYCELA